MVIKAITFAEDAENITDEQLKEFFLKNTLNEIASNPNMSDAFNVDIERHDKNSYNNRQVAKLYASIMVVKKDDFAAIKRNITSLLLKSKPLACYSEIKALCDGIIHILKDS